MRKKNNVKKKQLGKIKCFNANKQSSIKTKMIIYNTFPCSAITGSFMHSLKTKTQSSDRRLLKKINHKRMGGKSLF